MKLAHLANRGLSPIFTRGIPYTCVDHVVGICNLARIDSRWIVGLSGAPRSRDRLNPPLDAALYAALDIHGDPMETLRPDNTLSRFN